MIIVDDEKFENTEMFALQYSVPSFANVRNSEGTIIINILDDDS